MKMDGDGRTARLKAQKESFGVWILPSGGIDKFTFKKLLARGLIHNSTEKFEERKLKGTTANKISLFSGRHSYFMFLNHAQSSTTTDVICTSLNGLLRKGRLYTVYRNSPPR